MIFGLRTDRIEGLEQFLRVPGMDGVLRCFVSPVRYEANVICTPESLPALGSKIGGEQISSSDKATTFHRAWTEQQQHSVREEKRHGRYDVVWAQINEATINTAAYLRERVASLEKSIGTEVSRSRDLIDLRLPLATFRHNLDMLLGDVRSYKERARQRSAFKVSESGTVDVISNYVRHAEKPIVVLERLFEQRRSEAVQQSGMATDAALLALDGVTHFCGNLIEETHGTTPAHRRQWAVLLGRKVSFIDAPEFRGVLPINMSWTAPGASFSISGTGAGPQGAHVGVVEFPKQWILRCGSFPLIAWAVTGDYGSGGWTDQAIAELEGEIESEDTRLRKESGATSKLTGTSIRNLAETLFHDLVAISMMGPAYVYALARFGLLGRTGLMDWKGFAKYMGVVGEGLVRLRVDLRMLESLGLKVPFYTAAFGPVRKGLSSAKLKDLMERQGALVGERYELSVHKVMPDLIRGKVGEWEPDLVLNALWRGVAERRKYVNEAAVLWSLMRWGRESTGGRSA